MNRPLSDRGTDLMESNHRYVKYVYSDSNKLRELLKQLKDQQEILNLENGLLLEKLKKLKEEEATLRARKLDSATFDM